MLLKLMSRTSTISSYFSVKNFRRWRRGIVVQAGEQLGIHASDAGRRFAQAFAIRVFADRGQDLAHGPLDPRGVDRPLFASGRRRSVGKLAVEAAKIGFTINR